MPKLVSLIYRSAQHYALKYKIMKAEQRRRQTLQYAALTVARRGRRGRRSTNNKKDFNPFAETPSAKGTHWCRDCRVVCGVGVGWRVPLYPGAQVQLRRSCRRVHVAPFRHTPASHAPAAAVQFGARPGKPAHNTYSQYLLYTNINHNLSIIQFAIEIYKMNNVP